MNDQHPHAGYAGYDGYATGTLDATGSFETDPLFGSLPGNGNSNSTGTGYDGGYDASYDTSQGHGIPYTGGAAGYGAYDTTQWDTGAHQTLGTGGFDASEGYPAYADQAQQHPQYDAAPYDAARYDGSAQYDTTTTWLPSEGYAPGIPSQGGAPETSGQWDTTTWTAGTAWPSDDTASYDTGVYDATAWNTGATPGHDEQNVQNPVVSNEAEQHPPAETYESGYETYAPGSGDYDPYEPYRVAGESGEEAGSHPEPADDTTHDPHDVLEAADTLDALDAADGTHPAGDHRPAARPASRSAGRSRRRSPAKRSALLTVAVPSACVMSVAGIAAASVSGMGGDEAKKDSTTTMAAADAVKPAVANNKLDTQLANLSADAENFADRASRTQERIDLKARQAAEKKKREEEAARKEAMRPKFVMPVKQHGLSAYFGQAGVNWMSVHTGIDFPVQYGTPVMAATDGTVRTQYNSAYGNMAIVTMADGTETWYCHLSSTRIRSGHVKAGDVIAYSGNSGNSTGPHMHFEVRPGGGAAIDPLPWLRSHGVNPN